MPGINLLSCKGEVSEALVKLTESSMTAFPHITCEQNSITPQIHTITTTHAGYRVHTHQTGDWHILYENQHENALPAGIAALLNGLGEKPISAEGLQQLRKTHLEGLQGAFLLVAINRKTQHVAFANDSLARLPVYVLHTQGTFALGRDISIVKSAAPALNLNPLYLALNLIFAYVPGRGSFYDEIDTLKCGTLGVYDIASDKLSITNEPNLRFPEIDYSGKRKERLEELTDSFHEATQHISSKDENILALSGGFDSRAVIASLQMQNIPYEAVTYKDAENTASDDVTIATKIAQAVKCKHRIITMPMESVNHYHKLFAIKAGINYLGVAFFLQFLETVHKQYPEGINMITGDGGDKVMPSLLPKQRLSSGRMFLDYLYANNAIIPVQTAADLFGLKTADIDDYLLKLAEAYPGKDYSTKYKCFILAERGGRWLFEGEDRNRAYLNSETPFYDYRFYRKAMQIPDEWKQNRLFYRQFLAAIAPALSNIRLANSILMPSQPGYNTLQNLIALARRMKWWRVYRDKKQNRQISFVSQDWIMSRIRDMITMESVLKYLPKAELSINEAWLRQLNRTQLNSLYTVITIVNGGDAKWK
ncbi:MAG: hypothetical protein CVU50_02860 [Candidatus Cloacimonetes bacterium HGW-Cloacimonetes-3]|nr:MAG: hypothetical protein CVU50_02860 [Candidatus Cloacimonetes bacterium HGW-Cloacimonetes-3]